MKYVVVLGDGMRTSQSTSWAAKRRLPMQIPL